jgi:hypothetical protein
MRYLLTAILLLGQGLSTGETGPKLDSDDTILIQTAGQLGRIANDECNKLSSVQAFTTQRDAISKHLETKHPGYMFDWNLGTLVKK